jgi:hypothetical protein
MVFMPGEEEPRTTINIPPRNREPQASDPPDDDPTVGRQVTLALVLDFPMLEIKHYGNIRVRMKRGEVIHRIGALRVTELSRQEAVNMQLIPPTDAL